MAEVLVLASTSPRRRELLRKILPSFEVVSPFFDEAKEKKNESIEDYVLHQAKGKGLEASKRMLGRYVLSADTMVFYQGRLLGKPKSAEEAKQTLKTLQGQTHEIVTGWCLYKDEKELWIQTSESQLYIYPMDDEQIERYVATGSPLDKAGSYGIQDEEYLKWKLLSGSYENVMGLPIEQIKPVLSKLKLL